MPFGKWENFDACVADIMKTQGKDEESAKKICGALQARLGKESFSWVGDIRSHEKNLIRGKAIHPVITVHPEEWPSVRVYLEEELEKSAHTLMDKPLFLDHIYPLNGRVKATHYEDGAMEYVAELNDEQVLNWVRDGTIKHCSVEYDWSSLDKVDGVAPRGIQFTSLALLKDFEPGDPESSVEVWESIIKLKEAKFKEQGEPQEFIYHELRDPAAFLEDRFSTTWIDRANGIQGIYGRLRENPEDLQPMALLFMKANGWNLEQVKSWLQDHPQYVEGPEAQPPGVGVQASPRQPTQTGFIGESDMDLERLTEKVDIILKERVGSLENQLGIITDQKKALQRAVGEAGMKIETLEKQKADLTKGLGEAVIDPSGGIPPSIPEGYVYADDILAEIPRWIPGFYGYAPYKILTRIRQKCEAAKSRSHKVTDKHGS